MGRMITAHTALTGANTATGDLFEIVDISVTTDGPGGTNKKITRAELWNAMLEASPSTTLVVTNLDAGASGTAGTIDVFPSTASKGKLRVAVTDQTGDTTVTMQIGAMADARTITLPDPGASASYVLSTGTSTATSATSTELSTLAGVTAGTGAAGKAMVAAASTGDHTMTDGAYLKLSTAALAAAGTNQGTYAVVADQVNTVTGADGTTGVALPAAAAGLQIYIQNTVNTAPLHVAPVNGGNDAINGLTAGTGVFTMGPGKGAWFVATSGTQWYVDPKSAEGATVAAGGTLTLTVAAHAYRTILLDTAAGSVITLPDATGSKVWFEFQTSVIATSNSHIVKVPDVNNTMVGSINVIDAADGTGSVFGTVATADTITLNRTTTGSVKIGEKFYVQDHAPDTWSVWGTVIGTGGEANPFSATV